MDWIYGFFFGALIAVIITLACNNNAWKIEAVSHGYAQFKTDGTWHWNNEGGTE